MKKLSIKSKAMFGVIGAFILGAGVTAVTFASIPSSNTKVITACRNNLKNSLRIIDSQAGATCNNSESQLSWSGARSAIARFDYDISQPGNPLGIYNASKSRNIVSVKKGNGIDYGEGYCVHLNFASKFISPDNYISAYETDSGANGDLIVNGACGSGYEFFLQDTGRKAYYFTE